MTPDEELTLSRMHANRFVPARGGTPETQTAHAANYTAFYLYAVIEKLAELSVELRRLNGNLEMNTLKLDGILKLKLEDRDRD